MNFRNRFLVPVAALVIFCLLWEFLVWVNDWPNCVMASPSDLGPSFWKFRWLFLEYGWDTLWRTVAGLLLAIAFGVVVGMIMGFSRTMRDALYPLLVGFNAIPKATVVPVIALLLVGQHDLNTVLLAFMISFFPITVSISIGLSTLEPEYRDILASLGASRMTIFRKIALPKTLPEFFGALKVAVTLAFIGTNLMEIVEPHGRGLGHLFVDAGVEAHLGDAVAVAHVDEDGPTVVAVGLHPAHQHDCLPDMLFAQLSAVVGALEVFEEFSHDLSLRSLSMARHVVWRRGRQYWRGSGASITTAPTGAAV